MSAVYDIGTISVTNGSAVVTGAGTAWVGVLRAGWLIKLPNGEVGVIDQVVSATQLQLLEFYTGTTQTGQGYWALATGGIAADLAAAVEARNADVQAMLDGPGSGKFPAGTAALPGVAFTADQDTGMRQVSSNVMALTTGGVDRLSLGPDGAAGDAVQSSPADATAGKLLTAGAGGLLGLSSPPLTTSIDAFNIPSGTYHVDGNTVPGTTPSVTTTADTLTVTHSAANQTTQYYVVPNDGPSYYRKSLGNVSWGPWRRDGTTAYNTFAAFAADQEVVENAPNGMIIWADGVPYVAKAGATSLVDLPGWERAPLSTNGEIAASIADALDGIEDVTQGLGTFLPSITFETPGDLVVTYDATRAASWRRLNDQIVMSANLNTVTLAHATASGRLKLDFSASGFTASAIGGEFSHMVARFVGQGLTLPPMASGLTWIVKPGTSVAELAFTTPYRVVSVNTWNTVTPFQIGEDVSGAGITGRVDHIEYATIAGTAPVDQRLFLKDFTGSPVNGDVITGNGGGSAIVGGSTTVHAQGGTEFVTAEHVATGTPIILQASGVSGMIL